jgi:pimeloyl-ACP methyl ester carboxylesterase
MTWFDAIWHGRLKRPYKLHRGIDVGSGPTVVFLHGIGRSTDVWGHVQELATQSTPSFRMVGFDLLGFGLSPKPDRLAYSVDDHARAVIASLLRLSRRSKPMVLVGHSMGCLVAVRVARLRPDLVRHLILFEMPLYKGLPDKRRYQTRLKFYFNLYKRIIGYQPIFQGPGKNRARKIAEKITGVRLDDTTWVPFVRSLEHTIMEQTTSEDIKRIAVPMDVIYGTLDQVVIRGKVREVFGEDMPHITAHTIRETHNISRRASRFLLQRIAYVLESTEVSTRKNRQK